MMKLEYTNNVQKTVLTGVMAAILAALSLVSIPLPSGVPVTLQTFAVALCGFLLGPAMGTAAVAVYLIMGAVGLPVLAGMVGGLGHFLGVTGGFLWGFLPMALLCGLGAWAGKKLLVIPLSLAGLAACHLLGLAQFTVVAAMPVWQAFMVASAPYLIKDVISVILAYFGALAVATALKKAGLGGAA